MMKIALTFYMTDVSCGRAEIFPKLTASYMTQAKEDFFPKFQPHLRRQLSYIDGKFCCALIKLLSKFFKISV